MKIRRETEGPGHGERRFNTPEFKKAIDLASRYQMEHDEKLTAKEIESIGTQLGIDPGFIRQALDQAESRTVGKKSRSKLPGGSVLKSLFKHEWSPFLLPCGLALAWGALAWFTGWTLFFHFISAPLIAAMLGFLSGSQKIASLASRLLVIALAPSLGFPGFLPYLIIGMIVARKLAREGLEIREEHFPSHETPESTGGNPLEEPPPVAAPGEVSRQALLQAIFALQNQLDSHKQHRAFLSVDVVGSSEMVNSARELEVEYSFHQFRAWVEGVVKAYDGEITSSAGDGMMCSFAEDRNAIRAARTLQQDLSRFNAEGNRLPHPFRIRCGVSAGEVPLEHLSTLQTIQSPAIYRAAILQKQAEPGGIVFGEEVSAAARNELDSLTPLSEDRDTGTAYTWRSAGSIVE
ncbi:MAG: adenylate/guanylate cyclase domain-containing protein [Armatimonadetes bacterium]|nr:adenylate/guanylate cyclase domain-containing protein [Armatimonadota bacterium]